MMLLYVLKRTQLYERENTIRSDAAVILYASERTWYASNEAFSILEARTSRQPFI